MTWKTSSKANTSNQTTDPHSRSNDHQACVRKQPAQLHCQSNHHGMLCSRTSEAAHTCCKISKAFAARQQQTVNLVAEPYALQPCPVAELRDRINTSLLFSSRIREQLQRSHRTENTLALSFVKSHSTTRNATPSPIDRQHQKSTGIVPPPAQTGSRLLAWSAAQQLPARSRPPGFTRVHVQATTATADTHPPRLLLVHKQRCAAMRWVQHRLPIRAQAVAGAVSTAPPSLLAEPRHTEPRSHRLSTCGLLRPSTWKEQPRNNVQSQPRNTEIHRLPLAP
jgi:hypothetical protein